MVNLQETTPNNFMPTGIGALLRAARESMQLTERDVASQLNLSPKIISMMENEEFNSDLPVTFMRGYLRSYARLVKIPNNDIDVAIEKLDKTVSNTTRKTSPLHNATLDDTERYERYAHWITYLVILVLALLVAVWWNSHSRDGANGKKTNSQTVPLETLSSPTEESSPPIPVQSHSEESVAAPSQAAQLVNPVAPATPNTSSATPVKTPPAEPKINAMSTEGDNSATSSDDHTQTSRSTEENSPSTASASQSNDDESLSHSDDNTDAAVAENEEETPAPPKPKKHKRRHYRGYYQQDPGYNSNGYYNNYNNYYRY